MNSPAVAILIRRKSGEILSVSRRTKPGTELSVRWGLPGGKVDPGESRRTAAQRELLEETGVHVDADDLIAVYSAVCPGEITHAVTTFEVDYKKVDFSQLQAEEGLALAWLTEAELSNPSISPFASYNSELFSIDDCC